jgi:hypothetical protein
MRIEQEGERAISNSGPPRSVRRPRRGVCRARPLKDKAKPIWCSLMHRIWGRVDVLGSEDLVNYACSASG